jgi:RNA 2',3'-cyclic 3'-phosphodiesterase
MDRGDGPRGERLRAFVALELDPRLRERLEELIHRLRPELAGVRWVSPSSMHLTLRFLGWTSQEPLGSIQESLRRAAAECGAASLGTTGLGMFPERGSPRVLWVGLLFPEAFGRLQAACEQAAVAAGFAPETRAFQPHLTLGRWKERARRPSLPVVDLGPARFDHLTLFRSDLRPQGALYTALAIFPLGRLS